LSPAGTTTAPAGAEDGPSSTFDPQTVVAVVPPSPLVPPSPPEEEPLPEDEPPLEDDPIPEEEPLEDDAPPDEDEPPDDEDAPEDDDPLPDDEPALPPSLSLLAHPTSRQMIDTATRRIINSALVAAAFAARGPIAQPREIRALCPVRAVGPLCNVAQSIAQGERRNPSAPTRGQRVSCVVMS
jgi:hypothetical protein